MLTHELIEKLNQHNLPMANRIRMANNVTSSSAKAYSFIITGLKLLYPNITYNRLKKSITDCDRDGEFDAIVISRINKEVSVFEFKRNKGFKYTDARLLRDNIKSYLLKTQSNLTGLSNLPKQRIEQARTVISQGYKLKIYLVRSTRVSPEQRIQNLFTRHLSYAAVQGVFFLNADDLIKVSFHLASRHNAYEWPIKIQPITNHQSDTPDRILIQQKNVPVKSMLALLPLKKIIELQHDFATKGLNLFDSNVRAFQNKRALSAEIITSVKNYPQDFYIYHNGITFTCSQITPRTAENYIITNPQVINGCQTVSTLYHEYKDRPNDPNLSKAFVLCRFYALAGSQIEKVCQATNTQVKINLWDLRTNDTIQKIVEIALRVNNINYTRKKTTQLKKKVLITDLAQWIYSCKFGKPAAAKNNKSKLFDVFSAKPPAKSPYHQIFNENLPLQELTRICQIALSTKDKISKIKKSDRTFEKDADLHFIAAIFKLEPSDKPFDWKFNKVRTIIKQVITQLRKKHGTDFSYNKMFSKTDETWNLMINRLSKL